MSLKMRLSLPYLHYKCLGFVLGGIRIQCWAWSQLVNALPSSCIYRQLLFNLLRKPLRQVVAKLVAEILNLGFSCLKLPRCWDYKPAPPGPMYVSSVSNMLLMTSILETSNTEYFPHCRMLPDCGSMGGRSGQE